MKLTRRSRPQPAVATIRSGVELFGGPGLSGNELIAASELQSSPVELGIFDWVVDWADQMAAGRVSYLGRWKADHPLVRFGEQFWMDMCRAVYEWRGPCLPSKQRAVGLHSDHGRRANARRSGDAAFSSELNKLMYGLKNWLDATRGHDEREVLVPCHPDTRRWLVEDVERTCESAAAWAESVNLPDLRFEAEKAVEALKRAT